MEPITLLRTGDFGPILYCIPPFFSKNSLRFKWYATAFLKTRFIPQTHPIMSHHIFLYDVDCFVKKPRRMQLHGWYWKPWPSCTLATWTCCIYFHPSNSLCFSHMKCWSPATNIFCEYRSRLQKICIIWLLWLKNHFLSHLKMDAWNTFSFPFGFRPIFRCELAVSFRGCI